MNIMNLHKLKKILNKKASSNHFRLNFQNYKKNSSAIFLQNTNVQVPNLILVNTDNVWKLKTLVLSKLLKIYVYVYNILKLLELKKTRFLKLIT